MENLFIFLWFLCAPWNTEMKNDGMFMAIEI